MEQVNSNSKSVRRVYSTDPQEDRLNGSSEKSPPPSGSTNRPLRPLRIVVKSEEQRALRTPPQLGVEAMVDLTLSPACDANSGAELPTTWRGDDRNARVSTTATPIIPSVAVTGTALAEVNSDKAGGAEASPPQAIGNPLPRGSFGRGNRLRTAPYNRPGPNPLPDTPRKMKKNTRGPPSTSRVPPPTLSRGGSQPDGWPSPYWPPAVAAVQAKQLLNVLQVWEPRFFVGKNWYEYKTHFEACRCANNWDERQSLMVLKTRLSGDAAVIAGLPQPSTDYNSLIRALDVHFGLRPMRHALITRLRNVVQQPGETIQHFALRLLQAGAGKFESEAEETYQLLEAFKSNLRDTKTMRAVVTHQPKLQSLNDAMVVALDQESIDKFDRMNKADVVRDRRRRHSTESTEADRAAMPPPSCPPLMEVRPTRNRLLEVNRRIQHLMECLIDPTTPVVDEYDHGEGNGVTTTEPCRYCGIGGHHKRQCRLWVHNTTPAPNVGEPRCPTTSTRLTTELVPGNTLLQPMMSPEKREVTSTMTRADLSRSMTPPGQE